MRLYVGCDDYGGEDVDSSCNIPEILVESGVEISIVKVNDAGDDEQCDSSPSKPLQAIESPSSPCFIGTLMGSFVFPAYPITTRYPVIVGWWKWQM